MLNNNHSLVRTKEIIGPQRDRDRDRKEHNKNKIEKNWRLDEQ